jgi:hypothetical protein
MNDGAHNAHKTFCADTVKITISISALISTQCCTHKTAMHCIGMTNVTDVSEELSVF